MKGCYAAGGWRDETHRKAAETYYWRPGASKGMISLDDSKGILQALSGGGGCTLSYSFSRPEEHMRWKYEVWCKEAGSCPDLSDFAAFSLLKAGIARPFRHGCAAMEVLSHNFFLNSTLLEDRHPYAALRAHPTAVSELSALVYSRLHRAGVDGVASRTTSVRGKIVSSCNIEKGKPKHQQAMHVRAQQQTKKVRFLPKKREKAQQANKRALLQLMLVVVLVSLLCCLVARRF